MAACHFDANLPKPTSCQIVAKTVKGFWTALSDVMQCQTPSYHDSTCGEAFLRYGVKELRHSHLFIVPFCRTCGRTGMRAALSWMYLYTVSDVKRRNFSRAMKLFVEEPHHFLASLSTQHVNVLFEVLTFKSTLLSPSNDTTCCAPHFPVRRRTANIKLNCRPCMYVHVLEERAV